MKTYTDKILSLNEIRSCLKEIILWIKQSVWVGVYAHVRERKRECSFTAHDANISSDSFYAMSL